MANEDFSHEDFVSKLLEGFTEAQLEILAKEHEQLKMSKQSPELPPEQEESIEESIKALFFIHDAEKALESLVRAYQRQYEELNFPELIDILAPAAKKLYDFGYEEAQNEAAGSSQTGSAEDPRDRQITEDALQKISQTAPAEPQDSQIIDEIKKTMREEYPKIDTTILSTTGFKRMLDSMKPIFIHIGGLHGSVDMNKKAWYIENMDTLSADQKKTVTDFFTQYPNYEKYIDWYNTGSLTYQDFEKVFTLARIFGNHNYEVAVQANDFLIVIPLDSECAAFFSSSACGGEEALWNGALMKGDRGDEDTMIIEDKLIHLHFYGADKKIFFLIYFIKTHPVCGKKVWIEYEEGSLSYATMDAGRTHFFDVTAMKLIRDYAERPQPRLCPRLRPGLYVRDYVVDGSTLVRCYNPEPVIPAGVTAIGDNAFKGERIKAVDIPAGVTAIGHNAFSGCENLHSITVAEGNPRFAGTGGVLFDKIENRLLYYPAGKRGARYTIPAGITAIADGAFFGCKRLASIILPDSLTAIGESAFSGCVQLEDITLPAGLSAVGKSAFEGCTNLKAIDIPDGVTAIGDEAFKGCTSLTSVTLPASLTAVGRWAFFGCKSLAAITLPDSLTAVGNYAFSGCKSLAVITLPAGLTTIGDSAFGGCGSLGAITLPASLTAVGDRAFFHCKSLAAITLPASLTVVGDCAFYGCESLTDIRIPDSVVTIGSNAFYGCKSLVSITLPDSLTTIGESAFEDCENLASITLPASLTGIGESAFEGCENLNGITVAEGNPRFAGTGGVLFDKIENRPLRYPMGKEGARYTVPAGLTDIGRSAFRDCKNLTTLTLPDGLTDIGKSAFENCENLTSITLPASLTDIGDWAFEDCKNLITITVDEKNPRFADTGGVLFDKIENRLLCYPAGKKDAHYTIPDGITAIGNLAFYGCKSLMSITAPAGLATIGLRAFAGCESLAAITIPAGLTTIEDRAFEGCKSLMSITLPAGLSSIGFAAFECCKSIASITLPAGLTSIGDRAFWGCTSLAAITIPAGLTTIEENTFEGCESLTSITLPDSLNAIKDCAFIGCKSLAAIDIPESVATIGDYAFSYCEKLQTIHLSEKTKTGVDVFSPTLPDETGLAPLGSNIKAFLPPRGTPGGLLGMLEW